MGPTKSDRDVMEGSAEYYKAQVKGEARFFGIETLGALGKQRISQARRQQSYPANLYLSYTMETDSAADVESTPV